MPDGGTDPNVPRCDKCGAEITTGFMAFFCPQRERCEFFPDDADGQAFVREHWEPHNTGNTQS